jgi:hypothetical protein
MTITSERVEELRSDVHLARIRSGRSDASVTVRADVLSALLYAYEDQQARGIHTCHANCQRTECVQRRTIDRLERELARANGFHERLADRLAIRQRPDGTVEDEIDRLTAERDALVEGVRKLAASLSPPGCDCAMCDCYCGNTDDAMIQGAALAGVTTRDALTALLARVEGDPLALETDDFG